MEIKKNAVVIPEVRSYGVSKDNFYFVSKSKHLFCLDNLEEEILSNVRGLITSNSCSSVFANMSHKNTTSVLKRENSEMGYRKILLDCKMDYYANDKNMSICSRRNEKNIKEAICFYSLHDNNLIEVPELSKLNLHIRDAFSSYNDYLITFRAPVRLNEGYRMNIYNYQAKSLFQLQEAFSVFNLKEKFYSSLKLIYAKNGHVFFAHRSSENPDIPICLLGFNIKEQVFDVLASLKSFTAEKINYNASTRRIDIGFNPYHFQYDQIGDRFVSLGGSSFFAYDLRTKEKMFLPLNDLFEEYDVSATVKGTLYEDHVFFPSSRLVNDNKSRQWSLVAFNIRSYTIDWMYDFPLGIQHVSSPKVNENLMVAHDMNNNIHVFEKNNPHA